jgi:DNA-binding SARP family transcriptional activator
VSHEVIEAGPRVAVLGPLVVRVDGHERAVSGRRERVLLAALTAGRRSVVPTDRLVEDLWDGNPPPTAATALQVCVSRLRSALEPGRRPRAASSVIFTARGGYELCLPREAVDADRFADTVEAARALIAGDPARALPRLDEGLALWRGAAYADTPELPGAAEEAIRLEELRLFAREARLDALLALGRHVEAVPDAELLARQHPFRERLAELSALALYRGGRQADALAVVTRTRRQLADELGVDPSPALRRLEHDILTQAANLQPARQSISVRQPVSVAPPGRPTQAGRAEEPIVGRRTQLTALDDALADALGGRSALVLISGEPGIGKTRLATELRRRADVLGIPTLWGRCHETDAAPAFWPWHPILRDAAADAPGTDAALLPATSHLPPAATGRATDFDPASAPLRVYEAVTRHLADYASAHRAIAVVLDDVHWADPSSLHLLAFAAEALAHRPVLLVATLRDNHPRPDTALEACLANLARLHPMRLRLAGLDRVETHDLLRQSTGSDIDESIAGMIHRRADGNPFYARELARLLAGHAGRDLAALEIPDGVRDVVRRRVGMLAETAQNLLRLAAVAGREFSVDLLEAVSNTRVDDLIDACDQAGGHGLLDETEPGRYRFTHALVRETLYDDLSSARRGRLHGDIGSALEDRLANRPDLLGSVAYHLALGVPMRPALAPAAARQGIAASRQADLRYAYDDACALWQRTADALKDRLAGDPHTRFELLHGLGVARHRVGNFTGAQEALSEAIAIGRELGDIELVATAAVACGGPGLWNWRDYAQVDHEVIRALDECRIALPDGPLRCRTTANLSVELVYTWNTERADILSADAVEQARRTGDPETLAYALSCRFLAIWRPGTARERLATAEELTTAAEAVGSPDLELVARFLRACVLLELGRVDDADSEIAHCDAIATRLRRSSTAVQLSWWHCMRLLMQGRADDVMKAIPEAARRHRTTTVAGAAECEGTALAEAATATGRLDEALPRLLELAANSNQPVFHAVVARAAMAAGRLDMAAELLPAASAPGAPDNWHSLALDCLRTEVLAALGRTDELRRAVTRLRPHADGIALYGSIDNLGSVHYFLGVAAAACGDTKTAITELRQAVTTNESCRAQSWLTRSQDHLAALLERDNPNPRQSPST